MMMRRHPGLDRVMGGKPAPEVSLRSLHSLRSLGGGLACQPVLPRGLDVEIIQRHALPTKQEAILLLWMGCRRP